ncbi:MAG: hypothetical protein Q8W51_04195 [Candidatus Palauibacterales bacterium]|nr:hypothetical protein [Candidatus Palauibacterales bacterium]MDP2584045.1 hypothetical protein [Candidatus Palauibacterales bacterium]
MRPLSPSRRGSLLILVFAFAAAGCGRHKKTGPAGSETAGEGSGEQAAGTVPGLKTHYDVTYTDNTVVLGRPTVESSYLGRGSDSTVYRFKAGTSAVERLKPGQILFLSGLALRKVSAVSTEGGEIDVQTAPATLAEAIRNGTISWNYAIDWGHLPAGSYRAMQQAMLNAPAGGPPRWEPVAGPSATPVRFASLVVAPGRPLAAGGAPTLSLKEKYRGWDLEYKLQPTGKRVNMDLVASKSAGGKKFMAIHASGWISNFTQETILSWDQQTPDRIVVKTTGLEGQMEIKWSAFTMGEKGVTEVTAFQVPVDLPIPFDVGPIVAVLHLKAVLQVVPQLVPPDASSGGSWKVTYRSDQGFETKNTLPTPWGGLHDSNIGVNGETVSAGHYPVGFAVGVEFPRIELSVLGTATAFVTVKAYSSSMFQPGTVLTGDIPPCQVGETQLMSVVGYKLGFFGLTIDQGQKEIWKKKETKYLHGKPCTMTGKTD